MTFLRTTALTSALALMAGPALAQVSAEEVWSDWRDLLTSYGMTVETASENVSSGSVAVSGVVFGFEMPEGTVDINYGSMTFTETGSGTVAIKMNDTVPVTMNVSTEEGDAVISMVVSQPAAEMIASGSPDALRYDFSLPTLTVSDFNVEGADIPSDFPALIDITATDIAGFTAMKDADLREYDSVISMGTMAANISVDVPEDEGGGAFAIEFNLSDLEQTSSGTLGTIDMAMSAAEMILAGMTQESSITHGTASYTIDADGPDGAFSMQAAAQSGTFDLNMTEDGISYGGTSNDVTVSLSGDMIPFPAVNLAMAQSGGEVTMPLVPSEDAQDFGFVMEMIDLEIDDMIWGIFDPGQQLPRDPATLVIDVDGKAVITQDFTSPEFAENPVPGVPGTFEEVKINTLQLSLAGAELTGTGDFTFDNSAGMPMPAGVANLSLTGANTLLDTLVNMGLLPQEQAMGFRMMASMFTVPGPGEDSLTSKIEMTPDGQILANGQRIR